MGWAVTQISVADEKISIRCGVHIWICPLSRSCIFSSKETSKNAISNIFFALFTEVKFYAKVHFYHFDFRNGQRLSDAYLEHISFS